MSEAPKRGRGRPKGSKNKPGAAGVGRPRKDGRPPQPRHRHSEDSVSSVLVPPVPSTHVPSSAPAASTSSKATPKTFTAGLSANEGLTRPRQFTVSVLADSPSTSDTPPGSLSPGETSSGTSSSPSLPTHPSSQSPAPSESQPRGETCPAPHDGPIRLVQSTLFAAFGNCTSTTASSGGATSPAANKACTSPIQAYTTQGATTCPLPVAAMLESTPNTPPLSCATDTLGVSIHSLSESPSPSSALPPAGRDEGVMSPLPFSSLQLLEDGDEDEDFQLVTVTEPTQSACRMTAPTAAISELLLSRSVSPPHNARSSSPTRTPSTWSRQPVDNPYGSDITASGAVGDDEDEGEDEVPELEREFVPWNDEDAPDGEQTGVRSAPDSGDAGGNPDIRDSGQPRSSMPTWLKNDYLRVRERLVKEMAQNTSRMPTCYDRQTFYDGAENCFLAARSSYDGSAAGIFHQPQYFVWLPHLLVNRIPCPACKEAGRGGTKSAVVYLQKHGFVDSPRRIVDIDRNIFVIGYRYRCGHRDCRRNYQSWSPSILSLLPRAISDQFTFRLTYRAGLSDQLAALLRESFRGGIGSRVFATMVQALHYRRFDNLRCQFLEMVAAHSIGSLGDCWTSKRPFGEFSDRDGYAGYVPSVGYFGRFFDMMVEMDAPKLQQVICSCPATILKHDHSFKVIKRMKKQGGVACFAALHTFLNEYSEIRGMTFTPSKANDGWAPVLQGILPSLRDYGHPEPKVVFTDNIHGDKDQLCTIFPSLSVGVTPVEPVPRLEPLELPSDWEVVHLTNAYQVNLRFNIIMGQHTETSPVTIGFGIQWPVDTKTGVSGRVALLEFAYQKVVYLVQTLHFIRDGYISLPHALMAFLQSPVYTKIGINTVADLKRLHSDCALTRTAPFLGHVDIGIMAKGRNAAPKGCATLPMLSSIVLRHSLPQEPNVCVSSHWGKVKLLENFIMHAAQEVFAVWSIYSTLCTMDKPQTVSSRTPGGTSVTMMAPDGREIAQGVIALDRPTTFNGVNVTKTRVLMVVREVLVPAYMISGTLMQSRQPTPLSELGTVPFTIVCQAGHLRTQSRTNSLGHGDPVDFSPDLPPPSIGWDQLLESDMALNDSLPQVHTDPMDVVEGRYAWWEIVGESGDSENLAEQDPRASDRDPALDKAICDFLLAILKFNPDTQSLVRTRILGDIWHLFHQFPISLQHGLRRPFARALSAAIFFTDPIDKCAVEEILKKGNSSYEAKLLSKPKWVLARVRRYVPPAEILLSRVAAVIQTFGPLKDSTTGQPLFNEKAWDAAKNILEHIRGGYYSDPPGVSLYFEVGKDKHGLTLYRCCRGTNDLEGGVHQNLIRRWQASFNVSPRRAHNMALEYGVTHNMQVGTENRTGHPYKGHFDVPLKNRVSALLELTAQYFNREPQLGYGQWVNGDNYKATTESFGILPFDDSTRMRLSMLPYSCSFAREQKVRHRYLSERQCTRIAVLPVHTREERALFQLYASSSPHFTRSEKPDFAALASNMNAHADGMTIFYKIPEHLSAYYKTWLDYANEKTSVNLTISASKHIRSLLSASKTGSPPTIETMLPQTLAETVGPCSNPSPPSPSPWELQKTITDHQLLQSTLQFRYGDQPDPTTVRTSERTSRKRAANGNPTGPDEDAHVQKKKKSRTCRHCRSSTCEGRWAVSKCTVLIEATEKQAGQATKR